MNIPQLVHTIRFLKITQLYHQLRNRFFIPRFRELRYQKHISKISVTPFIKKHHYLNNNIYTFLALSSPFQSWNDTTNGMLWAYNLNYMEWLLEESMGLDEGVTWIDRFIEDLPQNKIGSDPYPIALRSINWIKFIVLHYDKLEEEKKHAWNNSLYSQYILLSKKLEYHLLGNHFLEDIYSLFIAAIYFNDTNLYKKASKLLLQELNEQILPDGSHYEQSPMYHCILLDRLLDCYNFSENNIRFEKQSLLNSVLKVKARQMLGHLQSIVYSDGAIPLLNDSAYCIAPEPAELFDYAKRLGLRWKAIEMKECGYRKLTNEIFESIVDVGNIMASYQPGHSHADTFNYELRIKGKPFIVDTGISTYNKTTRRQLERSTCAHNTVSVNGKDSSEVWGGFRVGNRAKVDILEENLYIVKARHNGFGKAFLHTRKFHMENNKFQIEDIISNSCDAVSFIHFSPDVKIVFYNEKEIVTEYSVIKIDGAVSVEITEGTVSTEYNLLLPSKLVKIHFVQKSKYTISLT